MPIGYSPDEYNDYFIVMEQTTPEDSKVEILSESKNDGLNYIRFQATLQTFYGRNRNRRDWGKGDIIKQMTLDPIINELMSNGSFVGEAGHPVPYEGKVSMERILTIDPLRTSHRITKFIWPNEHELHGIVETLDEGPGSPGDRLRRNILQGINPAFSLRSVVPQKKNADGSIDVIGPGRMICYDRVYIPSHKEAYKDVDIPVKNVVTKNEFTTVMESYCDYLTSHSDKIRKIVDDMEPAMESASIDTASGMVTMKTSEGRIFIKPESKYGNELKSILSSFD